MSINPVVVVLQAGRAAVAAGHPGYFSALPDADDDTYDAADFLLGRAFHETTNGALIRPGYLIREARLHAYDLAIEMARKAEASR